VKNTKYENPDYVIMLQHREENVNIIVLHILIWDMCFWVEHGNVKGSKA
jgi:hypothetical protein